MSALSNAAENASQTNNSITSISTNARIDYIQRFSKQAILVVDDNADIYTQIAGQYVGNLSDKYNTSLLTVSTRHNDIQIRCRIIEQLFGSVLFDPEQPLSVSILNFAKKNNETVSIVLEQVQNLSLQLFHELCQLVEMAKKTNIEINVLMVGSLDAGTIVSQNKILFKGKLSILSAQSGQLISINHPMFKKQGWINYAKVGYVLLALSLSVLLTVLGALALDRYEVISLEKIWVSISEKENETSIAITNTLDAQFVLPAKTKVNTPEESQLLTSNQLPTISDTLEIASNQDIFNALNVVPVVVKASEKIVENQQPVVIKSTKESDVKLDSKVNSGQDALVTQQSEQVDTVKVFSAEEEQAIQESPSDINLSNKVATKLSNFKVTPSYYQDKQAGFVVQISGFTTLKAYQEYVLAYPDLTHFTYLKQINNREMMIMTTPIYDSRVDAEKALADLPVELQNSGVWIKSLAAIKNEINAFATRVSS